MRHFKKIIILIIIQAFLASNAVFAQRLDLNCNYSAVFSTLSPQIAIRSDIINSLYNFYAQNNIDSEYVMLTDGRVSYSDIIDNGIVVNDKTTNFKIGKNSFRLPPYLSNRIVRLHITGIYDQVLGLQKMGIGVGQRKKTTAVILADLINPDNQLLIFEENNKVIIKPLSGTGNAEEIQLGNKAQFSTMDRQDSFLERSALGINFINQVLAISKDTQAKPKQVVEALSSLAQDNPKLKKDLGVNQAFFSQDYLINFSENLVNYAHVTVLRDREQRGRFIAIVDKLNPDNRVVFERRGEKVYILGENEQLLIPQLEKHPKAQVIYFTDLEQGAQFCRNVSRDLIKINFSKKSSSLTIRKNVQLNLGANNSEFSILKANQVTKSTLTGHQIKQRQPELIDQTLAEYPLYILGSNFKTDISLTDADIDYDSADYLFFDPQTLTEWPVYLSYGSAENSGYYQYVSGSYEHEQQPYTVYRAIGNQDMVSALLFNDDGSFTIRGINWNDQQPVVFKNVKNIAISNIVSQLAHSKFITIDSGLNEYFNGSGLDAGINPIRSTYEFKAGFFEQAENIKMDREIDYTDVQKKQDKIIKKNKKSGFKLNKAAFILSVFSIVFTAQSLLAAEHAVFNQAADFSFPAIILSALVVFGIFSIISPVKPVFSAVSVKQEKKETPDKSGKTKKKVTTQVKSNVSLSEQAKLLSANYALLEQINNSADEQGRTFFSLKSRSDNQEKSFVIRMIDSEREIDDFQEQLGRDRNFKWKKIFQMIEYFREKPEFAERFLIYGVFALDEYGKEQQIVAAADYIIREIDGKAVLNGGHIEILPQIREAYSGMGKSLFTKLLSDAFTLKNLKLTQGRMFFIAENKGNSNNPISFYKQVLGLTPKIKTTFNENSEETSEFELSLEESLAFLQREFMKIGFSPELKTNHSQVVNTDGLDKIDLNTSEMRLINQAI